MSNILIIKHGSLGDLIQANGAIQDIKNSFKNSKIYLLTSSPYVNLMTTCPYLDGVLIDRRLPRWNIFYLISLKKMLTKFNFSHVFDLQNSSRTKFYRKYLLSKNVWSSTETTLEKGQNKEDFDQDPVLQRMELQLKKSGVKTNKINNIDLSWAFVEIDNLLKKHTNKEYILIFPFCSKKHPQKKWPFFKDLIKKIIEIYKNKYSILISPGPGEIDEAKSFNTEIVLSDKKKPLNINQLITLINNSSFVISNDTGPAHICSHLNKKGLVLFGKHTSPEKVSIEKQNFEAISVQDLNTLTVDTVIKKIKNSLN
jgi:ADP-heptose:LPS heptosyltransferase|tara:strand:+ start:859 stop:1794 length:936 start_codon:yes stop_codon:yes gene_type:complete